MLQRLRGVASIVFGLTGSRNKPKTHRSRDEQATARVGSTNRPVMSLRRLNAQFYNATFSATVL